MFNKWHIDQDLHSCIAGPAVPGRRGRHHVTPDRYVRKAGRRFCMTIMTAAVFCICGCSGSGPDSTPVTVSGGAGVLTYSGDFNGKIEFETAECVVLGGMLASFKAPAGPRPPESGTVHHNLLVMNWTTPSHPASMVFDFRGTAHHGNFVGMSGKTSIGNVHVEHQSGQWKVVLDGTRISDLAPFMEAKTLEGLAHTKAKDVYLKGTLRCTEVS